MDVQAVVEVVWGWIQAADIPLIVGLVVADLVLGIAAAIKAGVFRWSEVGRFYQTNVAPYLIGYVVLRLLVDIVPDLSGILGSGLALGAFGAIIGNLVASIAGNVKALGFDAVGLVRGLLRGDK